MGAIGVPAVPQANTDERHRWDMAGPSIERIGHNPPYTGRCGSSRMPCPLEGGRQGIRDGVGSPTGNHGPPTGGG